MTKSQRTMKALECNNVQEFEEYLKKQDLVLQKYFAKDLNNLKEQENKKLTSLELTNADAKLIDKEIAPVLRASVKKVVDVSDWDALVEKTYGKPYSFQQQEGCKSRGTFDLTVPCKETEDEKMHEEIPEIVNGDVMGVKFESWLKRDVSKPVGDNKDSFSINLFWQRSFYPDIHILANDLYMKGLIESGKYVIDIDW